MASPTDQGGRGVSSAVAVAMMVAITVVLGTFLLGIADALERVPMVDDRYDDRNAAADFACLLGGTAAVVRREFGAVLRAVGAVGGGLVGCGVVLVPANVELVVHRHSPRPWPERLVGIDAGDRSDGHSNSTLEEHRSGE